MTQLSLKNLTKSFDQKRILDGLDLTVNSGELVALLGASGSGKTTILRLIAGLETHDAGAIFFDERDVTKAPVGARDVGLVFQNYALFPHMNVERNVSFGLRVKGVDAATIEARVSEILDIVQLSDLRKRYPSALSGGQKQRVAIARTLITEPKILMLDEPLANLDANLRAEMRRFIMGLQKRLGLTTIFVTHDQAEAMEMADRVALLEAGRVAQYDAPMVLYQRPRTVEIARFLGAENVFSGRALGGGRFTSPLGEWALPPGASMPAGEAFSFLVRAEHVELSLEKPNAPALEGEVGSRQFQGARMRYEVRIGEASLMVEQSAKRVFEENARVYLTVDPAHFWIFP